MTGSEHKRRKTKFSRGLREINYKYDLPEDLSQFSNSHLKKVLKTRGCKHQ